MREKVKPHPQPNSIIRAIPSYIYIQLDARPVEEDYKKIVRSWKSSELKSAEQYKGKCYKPSPSAQFSIRAIPSYIYIQLDARPIEKDYREIVYSWKSSELKSAEPCEKRKTSLSTQFSVRAILSRVYIQLNTRPIEEDCGKIVS